MVYTVDLIVRCPNSVFCPQKSTLGPGSPYVVNTTILVSPGRSDRTQRFPLKERCGLNVGDGVMMSGFHHTSNYL